MRPINEHIIVPDAKRHYWSYATGMEITRKLYIPDATLDMAENYCAGTSGPAMSCWSRNVTL